MKRTLAMLVCLGTAACEQQVTQADFDSLSLRVGALEQQAPAPAVSAEQAQALLKQLDDSVRAQDWDTARATLAQAEGVQDPRLAAQFERVASEVDVVGREAPPLEVERWFTGETDFEQGQATLVVFWELWCPHCRREVPALQASWDKYQDKGLNMVGLTRLSKSSTAEAVEEFIDEQGLDYPIAKVADASISERFGVQGIPAAAVVKDGEVVWRGHPARIDEAMIEGWIQ